MSSKVSVIMPIYNAQKYLRNMLLSILKQDYHDYEVIAVNDASDDDTLCILEEMSYEFKKSGRELVIVNKKQNGGLCSAINAGIAVAKGDFYCFPDADDELHPSYISSMMHCLLSDPAKGWVRCNYTIILEEEEREYDVYLPKTSYYLSDFYDFISKFIPHNAWNMIVSRRYFEECIGRELIESRLTQEWPLLLPLSIRSNYMRCDKVLYRYYIRKGAMSSWQNGAIESVIDHINRLKALNDRVLDSIQIEDPETIGRCQKALSLYYSLMRYKKFVQYSKMDAADQEMMQIYEMGQDVIGKQTAERIGDLEMYVRLVFDRMLEADLSGAREQFLGYKKIFKSGYIIYYDASGKRLIKILTAAFGEALQIIDLEQKIICPAYLNVPRACLIENSKKFSELKELEKNAKGMYIDYRELRNALRGWHREEETSDI